MTLVWGDWELTQPTTAPVGFVWSVRSSLESCTSLHDEFVTARPFMTSSSSSYKRGILRYVTFETETGCPWKRLSHQTSPERVEERQGRRGGGRGGVEKMGGGGAGGRGGEGKGRLTRKLECPGVWMCVGGYGCGWVWVGVLVGACRWMGVGGEGGYSGGCWWVAGSDIQTPATSTQTLPLPNANVQKHIHTCPSALQDATLHTHNKTYHTHTTTRTPRLAPPPSPATQAPSHHTRTHVHIYIMAYTHKQTHTPTHTRARARTQKYTNTNPHPHPSAHAHSTHTHTHTLLGCKQRLDAAGIRRTRETERRKQLARLHLFFYSFVAGRFTPGQNSVSDSDSPCVAGQ